MKMKVKKKIDAKGVAFIPALSTFDRRSVPFRHPHEAISPWAQNKQLNKLRVLGFSNNDSNSDSYNKKTTNGQHRKQEGKGQRKRDEGLIDNPVYVSAGCNHAANLYFFLVADNETESTQHQKSKLR